LGGNSGRSVKRNAQPTGLAESMIVVTDATPLRYLVLIEETDILTALYYLILTPPACWRVDSQAYATEGPAMDCRASRMASSSRSAEHF